MAITMEGNEIQNTSITSATVGNIPETDGEKSARLERDNTRFVATLAVIFAQYSALWKDRYSVEREYTRHCEECANQKEENASLKAENTRLQGSIALNTVAIQGGVLKIEDKKTADLEAQVKQLHKENGELKAVLNKNIPNPKKRYLSLNDLEDGPSSKVSKSNIEPIQPDNKQL